MTHTERIAAAFGLGLVLLLVIGFLFDRWVLAVWWWPWVGSSWRRVRRQRKLDAAWDRAAALELPGPAYGAEQPEAGRGANPQPLDRAGEPDWEDEPSTDDDADQMIATWHGDDEQEERVPTPANVWDLWWAELDGLDRECLKVRATVEHQDRLWAELVQETRQLCPLAA